MPEYMALFWKLEGASQGVRFPEYAGHVPSLAVLLLRCYRLGACAS